MLKLIEDFPNHITEGIEIAKQTNFTKTKNNIQNVVLCGMGGSGIGAKIVSDWVRSEANIPVTLVADYFLPDFVSENTLADFILFWKYRRDNASPSNSRFKKSKYCLYL